jgi:hypothetical protein
VGEAVERGAQEAPRGNDSAGSSGDGQRATQVRIVSDGTPAGTRLYVGDVPVTGVTYVGWFLGAGEHFARVRVDLAGVPVDLRGEVQEP